VDNREMVLGNHFPFIFKGEIKMLITAIVSISLGVGAITGMLIGKWFIKSVTVRNK